MLESISGDRIAPKQTAEALIIHDEEDNEILIYQAEALAAAWPKNQFVRTTGLGHRRIIRSGEIIRQVAEFVTR
jgi:pimeloyl-ACP methyl ester carboxylesterase